MDSVSRLFSMLLEKLFLLPLVGPYIKKGWDIVLGSADLYELVTGSGVGFLAKLLSLPLGYAISLIIARGYGADALGLYGLSLTVISITSAIAMFGMGPTLTRVLGEMRSTGVTLGASLVHRKVSLIVFVCSCTVAFLLYSFSGNLAIDLFDEPRLTFPLRVISFFIPIVALKSVQIEFLKAVKDIFHAELLEKILGTSIFFVLLVIFFFFWKTYYLPIWAYLLTNLLLLIIGLSYVFNTTAYIANAISISTKKLLSLGSAMFVTALSGILISHTDIIMLGIYLPVDQVGVYKIVISLSSLVGLTMLLVGNITGPKIAEKYWAKDFGGLQKMLHQSTLLIVITAIPIILLLVFAGKWILGFLGTEFVVGFSSLIVLLIGSITHALSGCNYHYMNVTGKEKGLRNVLLVTALFNIVSNTVLIPLLGILGAALSTSVTFILSNLRIAYIIYKEDNIVLHFQLNYLLKAFSFTKK